ncbi:MAG: hypothetical protein BWY85_01911 [Firmicutes bacterium ADurb.Bin506]|nr:MAG: hypothetical protein BWY85_01911 [Firmicutes bacterium ADurb.Bin506]
MARAARSERGPPIVNVRPNIAAITARNRGKASTGLSATASIRCDRVRDRGPSSSSPAAAALRSFAPAATPVAACPRRTTDDTMLAAVSYRRAATSPAGSTSSQEGGGAAAGCRVAATDIVWRASTAALSRASRPLPVTPTVGTTGTPSAFESPSTSMSRPLSAASSIMFSATTMGTLVWMS